MGIEAQEPIAIVGSACHFAGSVTSPSKLWELLRSPRDLRSEIPDSRFNPDGFYHPNSAYHGHSNVRHAYLLDEEVSCFDAEFFGISPVEVKAIDPQQRFLMETVYEGLEAAGMTIESLRGSDTSVYVGVMCDDFAAMQVRDIQTIPTYFATGTGRSMLANRVSYFFDWHGPSVSLDTACSSSLVAIHMAVQALRTGESRVSLACGSNLILGPENFIVESKLKMLSPDGRSRMWDQGANGYARGEGVAAVVLKTLSAALADGDHIECLIRETGVNQDGATTGITMPSATAQISLIQNTYAKAGLDPQVPLDRPQYFEAHGTGTPAGDPIEAEAISKAFFGDKSSLESKGDSMYVGSVKTVLGHTEGTAGVAAVMKASLALQNAYIPPNLLFDQLSERVAPFYTQLEIAKSAQPWPLVPHGQPRRASVNSFGFGGTNAHAILETYNSPSVSPKAISAKCPIVFTPFVFSATSQQSLAASLYAYATFLEEVRGINFRDLAWTLRQRRSAFPYRIAFAAESIEDLQTQLRDKLEDASAKTGIRAPPASKTAVPGILAIFTGQGAQYGRMGAELVENSQTARRIVQDLEWHLAQLPGKDRPTWSLQAEMLADASNTRVSEAAISQPLCTAVQIMLVDLLRLAGMRLAGVVGHSSGEIAAAYASDYLSARDAIRIAYYRGLHAQLASSHRGKDIKGRMIAVGTSMEDAMELCADRQFAGRIGVAASNSASSVTISGDEDAIAELQLVLDDEKLFNRRLKVDKAYHSNHMLPCFGPYVESLRQCGVKLREPSEGSPSWFSSVHDREIVDSDLGLSDTYWAENMVKPVLFSQALSTALSTGEYQVAVEIGPHPGLEGPARQTIQEVLGKDLPYQGLLSRGTDAVKASSTALGFLWSHLDKTSIDLDKYERSLASDEYQFQVVKGLPTYGWNHESRHWNESRASRKLRLRSQADHPLLGHMSTENTMHHMSWRHLLRPSEIDWLSGHRVQGQIVFPAAGYVSTALEASLILAAGSEIKLVELSGFVIHQALTFDTDDSSIEVLISLADITRPRPDCIRAKFSYSASLISQGEDLTLVASGELDIIVGSPASALLPNRQPSSPQMIEVDGDRFYAILDGLGYNFSGSFRALASLRRMYGRSSCVVERMARSATDAVTPLVQPAELDASFQAIILAYSYPDDDELLSLHLPTSIEKIRINPSLCSCDGTQSKARPLPVDSIVAARLGRGKGVMGDANIYIDGCSSAMIQIQGVKLVPLSSSAIGQYRKVFSKTHWVNSVPDGKAAAYDIKITQDHEKMRHTLDRISTFYLRQFDREVPPDDPIRTAGPNSHYLQYARHITSQVEAGTHKWAQETWLSDTMQVIMEATMPLAQDPTIQMAHIVGQQMPRVFRNETTILEQLHMGDVLGKYYTNGFGFPQARLWLSRTLAQITDRYLHLNILELVSETGSVTESVMQHIRNNFVTYTVADQSMSADKNTATSSEDRILSKSLDIERDPVVQGYTEGAYEVIIAPLVICGTKELERTLRNIRKLLKPGGFLLVADGSCSEYTSGSNGFILGSLPAWWSSVQEGRTLSPFVTTSDWDRLLRATGFSGIDSRAPRAFEDTLLMTVFVSQAVDQHISFLREPLAIAASAPPPIKNLVIVGGQTDQVAGLVANLRNILQDRAENMHVFETLRDVDHSSIESNTAVICLTELDEPVFKNLSPDSFHAFKTMFETEKTLLWVTSGRLEREPLSNLTVGFGRTAVHETPALRLQSLDFSNPQKLDAWTVAETLLRLHFTAESDGKLNMSNVLWAVESEILVNDVGQHLVPRLQPIAARNDRYNSARRPITHEIDTMTSALGIYQDQDGWSVEELPDFDLSQPSDQPLMEMRIVQSTLFALSTPFGPRFLALGFDPHTKASYLALVSSLISPIKIPKDSVAPYSLSAEDYEAVPLSHVAAQLVATAILKPLIRGQTLALHNPSPAIADAVAVQAKPSGVRVLYMADSIDGMELPSSWIPLPHYLTQTEVRRLLPPSISCFVGLSNHERQRSANEATILSCLPSYCYRETANTLYSASGCEISSSCTSILGQSLRSALEHADKVRDVQWREKSVQLKDLTSGTVRPIDPATLINWASPTSLTVYVNRLDSRPIFKSDRTYWMVGLTRGLGISLCDWMIGRGARNLVLTSRTPDISAEWVAAHKKNGVTVAIVPCDITDEAQLKSAHETIRATMPPMAGVLNGAMVLRDVAIRNMSFEQMNDVLRPKVSGTINLDRLFWDLNLDFFLLFSSTSSVAGNPGQANYSAANSFLCSLAAQRRKRGLAATALNCGAIIGAGYMARESSKALDLTVSKMAMMHLSEGDYHQLFVEGIDAGRVDSHDPAELTTGFLDIQAGSANAPRWESNPTFGSFVIHQSKVNQGKDNKTATLSIHDQLLACQTQRDVYQVVKETFAAQLRYELQMTTLDDDLMTMRGNEIGLDSLISIDIRSWILQNFSVSVPVLKIMGNDTMADHAQFTADNMPPELIPQLRTSETLESTTLLQTAV